MRREISFEGVGTDPRYLREGSFRFLKGRRESRPQRVQRSGTPDGYTVRRMQSSRQKRENVRKTCTEGKNVQGYARGKGKG